MLTSSFLSFYLNYSYSRKRSNADINLLEEEIDQMVYQLYNLTEDEIKIVERERERES